LRQKNGFPVFLGGKNSPSRVFRPLGNSCYPLARCVVPGNRANIVPQQVSGLVFLGEPCLPAGISRANNRPGFWKPRGNPSQLCPGVDPVPIEPCARNIICKHCGAPLGFQKMGPPFSVNTNAPVDCQPGIGTCPRNFWLPKSRPGITARFRNPGRTVQ